MAKLIGAMLVEAGVISQEQLATALSRQQTYGGRLATYCWQLGYADEATLAAVLSLQQGTPFVVISQSAIPVRLCDELPHGAASQHLALPVRREGRNLLVALANPRDIRTLDELRFGTGARVVEHGALVGPLQSAIREMYQLHDAGVDVFYSGPALEASRVTSDEGYVATVRGDRPAPLSTPPADSTVSGADLTAGWSEAEARRGVPTATPGAQPSVLVVDDEPDIRQILSQFLLSIGYRVREAPDGLEALQLLRVELPDAMVLDAMLPGVHGFDLCQRVKGSAATQQIKVIMISAVYRGWRYADDIQRMYGADAFLEKPFRLEQLQQTLERVLRGRPGGSSAAELTAQATDLLHRSATAYRQGNKNLAADLLEEAVVAAPFSADLHRRLGLLYEQLGQPYRAIAAFERLAELETTFSNILKLAQIYELSGFVHKAFEAWERCLWLCGDPAEAERIRGHMNTLMTRG